MIKDLKREDLLRESPILVSEPQVVCDGGGEAGHPRVFLHINAQNWVDCPYCGRSFVLRETSSRTSSDRPTPT